MIQAIKQNKKAVLAFLLALVMLIGLIPFTATEVQALTIPVGDITTNDSFGNGDTWQDGDQIKIERTVGYDSDYYTYTASVDENGITTWALDKKLYWDGKEEHILAAFYPAAGQDDYRSFELPNDQSTLEKLKLADCMNAVWVGNPTTDPINFQMKHRLSMVTVNYEFASEFTNATVDNVKVIPSDPFVMFDAKDGGKMDEPYGVFGTTIDAYHVADNKTIQAIVIPCTYPEGQVFMKISVNGEELQVKMPEAKTFEEGTHYTFDLKVGKDKATLTQVSASTDFPGGWDEEKNLNSGDDFQGPGKTAWVENDAVFVSLDSEEYGLQTVQLNYQSGVWTPNGEVKFSYLNEETPKVTAVYAPDYEIKSDKAIGLIDGKQYGEAEYIPANVQIGEDGTLTVSFADVTRSYSRLRIATMPGAEITVKTTDFTPAGATAAGEYNYTLTADANGNAFLYGSFKIGATIEATAVHEIYPEGGITRTHTFDRDWQIQVGESYVLAVKLGDWTDANQVMSGDIALSDGSFVPNYMIGSMTDAQKAAAVGIVFWTTKETDLWDESRVYPAKLTDDKVMNVDFPQCTHGLIVSLKNLEMAWQGTSTVYESVYDAFQNTDLFNPSNIDKSEYVPINAFQSSEKHYNSVLGYNNTKILEAYNAYCKTNGKEQYVVKPIEELSSFAEDNAAPFGSTGWYLPSAKELHMLCHKDVDDIGNVTGTYYKENWNSILSNANVDGDAFVDGDYWSSTDHYSNTAVTINFTNGADVFSRKFISYYVRFICAF